jgi:hypothetical protein
MGQTAVEPHAQLTENGDNGVGLPLLLRWVFLSRHVGGGQDKVRTVTLSLLLKDFTNDWLRRKVRQINKVGGHIELEPDTVPTDGRHVAGVNV